MHLSTFLYHGQGCATERGWGWGGNLQVLPEAKQTARCLSVMAKKRGLLLLFNACALILLEDVRCDAFVITVQFPGWPPLFGPSGVSPHPPGAPPPECARVKCQRWEVQGAKRVLRLVDGMRSHNRNVPLVAESGSKGCHFDMHIRSGFTHISQTIISHI